MNNKHFPHILLIAGSGRNCGKTSLGEALLKSNSSSGIIALKVSNHFHGHYNSLDVFYKSEGLIIGEELESSAHRDSNRYLGSGAKKSIYAECSDEMIPELLNWLSIIVPKSSPVICESGGLGNYIRPGLAFFLNGGSKVCKWNFPYYSVVHDSIEETVRKTRLENDHWYFNEE